MGIKADLDSAFSARQTTLFESYDAEIQKRLSNPDIAIAEMADQLRHLREEHKRMLACVEQVTARLGVAEQAYAKRAEVELRLAEWDRPALPQLVTLSCNEFVEKASVPQAILPVFTRAGRNGNVAEIIGSDRGKKFVLLFGGDVGVGALDAKRFLDAARNNGQ